jgi:hypothetical protein
VVSGAESGVLQVELHVLHAGELHLEAVGAAAAVTEAGIAQARP